ncbi:glycosyltransferase family 2 protein [Halorussus halobius]|uniref:glycosyltransferase family 2 protein n=1 Tax=Halorussus halobius TaxID=1710537 RepID=UPI001092678A|nr:glycosyltransferase family 2 protein [Halorussus halobius]
MGDGAEPLVSVVVPTYDRPDRVERAVASVAAQTYDRIEVLVVDDCSTNPVADVLCGDRDRTFERFEVLRHDRNRGGSAARNTGIRASDGDYVALLDDDDRWEPEKVERQVELLDRREVGVVTTGAKVLDRNGQLLRASRHDGLPGDSVELTKRLLCRNVVGSCSSVMVDGEVVDAVGGFDERFPSWQDLEWYVRLSRHCRFGVVPEPLLVYRRDADERVSDDLDVVKDETYPLFLDEFAPVAAEYGPMFERKMRAWTAYRVGKQLVLAGRVREGRPFLTRAVGLYPFESSFYVHCLPALGGAPTYEAVRKTKRAIDRIA